MARAEWEEQRERAYAAWLMTLLPLQKEGFELKALPEIKVGVAYRLDGREIDYLPASERAQARVEPVYETMEGWQGKTALARSWAELPAQAIKYVRRVEELVGCSVALLSTSPEREDTILVHNPFEN